MSKIRAIFQSTGAQEGEWGKKGVLYFSDVSINGELLTNKYTFDQLKCFTKYKPKKGDVFEFEATLSKDPLSIKRPKQVVKVDLSYLSEGYAYCINKFLKENKRLTKEESRNEKVAYVRLTNIYPEEFFKFVNLPFRLNSLHWFLYNLEVLKEQYKKYQKADKVLDFKEDCVKLEDEKIGEDVKFDKKGNGLMSFMK